MQTGIASSWAWRWQVSALVFLGAVAAGCAPAQPLSSGEAPGGAQAAQPPGPPPGPARGGVLQWAPPKAQASLHPHKGGTAEIMRHTGAGYESLISFKHEPGEDFRAKLDTVPWLAESWNQLDDLTYIFSIRKGVKWHDGTDFTATDVLFTYEWLRQEKLGASSRLALVDRMEAPDPYTVRLILKSPASDMLVQLADRNLLIVPKHAVERGDDLNKVLIGTGPFKIKSFRSGAETVWERFPDYWQPGRPYADGVRQIWTLDPSAMMAAFIAGDNDLLSVVDVAQLESVLQTRPVAGFQVLPSDIGVGLLLKLDRPPFSDARVRRAVQLAVDREAMNQTLSKGKGMYVTPGAWAGRDGWTMPQEELRRLPGFRQPKDQDMAEARRLLAEAGYPQGLSFDLIYNGGGSGPPRIAEVLSPQLRGIGITANLKPMESAAYNQVDLQTGDWAGGNLPTLVNSQFRELFDRFHSQGPRNKMGLNDPQLDSLIEGTLAGKDVEARRRTARRLQEYFLEQVYYVPTVEPVSTAMWQPWVHDYHFNGGNLLSPHQDTYGRLWLDVQAMPAARR